MCWVEIEAAASFPAVRQSDSGAILSTTSNHFRATSCFKFSDWILTYFWFDLLPLAKTQQLDHGGDWTMIIRSGSSWKRKIVVLASLPTKHYSLNWSIHSLCYIIILFLFDRCMRSSGIYVISQQIVNRNVETLVILAVYNSTLSFNTCTWRKMRSNRVQTGYMSKDPPSVECRTSIKYYNS